MTVGPDPGFLHGGLCDELTPHVDLVTSRAGSVIRGGHGGYKVTSVVILRDRAPAVRAAGRTVHAHRRTPGAAARRRAGGRA
jgi:hypothetical protein